MEFFQAHESAIKACNSEILLDYMESIKRQYKAYNSEFIPSKKEKTAQIWGRIFEGFVNMIKKDKEYSENLSFGVMKSNGHYWSLYITYNKTYTIKNENTDSLIELWEYPVLDIKSNDYKRLLLKNLMAIKDDDVIRKFAGNIEIKRYTESNKPLDQFGYYVIPWIKFENDNLNGIKEDNLTIADYYKILEEICRVYLNICKGRDPGPFVL